MQPLPIEAHVVALATDAVDAALGAAEHALLRAHGAKLSAIEAEALARELLAEPSGVPSARAPAHCNRRRSFMTAIRQPRAILLDMHGTLLRQTHWDPAAGTRAVLALAINDHGASAGHINEAVHFSTPTPRHVRREASMLEASPWAVERSSWQYERLRVRFAVSQNEVEATFLRAARCWTPADGIHEALEALHELGFAMAVISNSAFSSQALSRELQEGVTAAAGARCRR